MTEEVNRAVAAAEDIVQVRIVVLGSPYTRGDLIYRRVGPGEYPQLFRILKLYTDEFRKYPKSFLARSGIKYVAFVRDLAYRGNPVAGTVSEDDGGMWLDVPALSKDENRARHTMHHEHFHLIDDQIRKRGRSDDFAWTSLNPPGFGYQGHRLGLTCGQSFLDYPRPGLVTAYAATNPAEDKAEVFAALLTRYSEVAQLARKDSAVRKKMAYMLRLMKSLDGAVDEEFLLGVERREPR